jgi:DNA-binding MarR family transcriptional regulator
MMKRKDFVDRLVDQWRTEMPGPEYDGLAVFARLARFTQLASRDIYRGLEKFELTESQVNMLAALYRAGEPHRLSPTELSTAMLLTPGTITYVIDQMVDAGNVVRRSDPSDRRKVIIELTEAGSRRVQAAMRSHVETCLDLLSALSTPQRKQLNDSLRILLLSVDEPVEPTGTKEG